MLYERKNTGRRFMIKQKKVLVLFEDGVIKTESILYSVELARRLKLPVALLMLVSTELKTFDIENVLAREITERIEPAKIEATSEIRYGDKATELLKYLAANSNPAAIVWGSEREIVGQLGTGKPHHWLNKLSHLLPCSIVSPIAKNKDGNKIFSEG